MKICHSQSLTLKINLYLLRFQPVVGNRNERRREWNRDVGGKWGIQMSDENQSKFFGAYERVWNKIYRVFKFKISSKTLIPIVPSLSIIAEFAYGYTSSEDVK